MDVLIFYILFSSFLFGIMILVFKKVSKVHTQVNTFSFWKKSNTKEQIKVRKRDFKINITFYSLLIFVALIITIVHKVEANKDGDLFFDYLFNGLQFQVVSSILFILLSIVNPFIIFPEKVTKVMDEKNTFLKYIINNNNKSFIIRVIISVALIVFFIFKKWLMFIPYYVNFKILQGINILLLAYLFKNIFFMKVYPVDFFQINVLRLVNGVLYIKIFAFVLLPLAPFTMLTLHFLGFDENKFPFWTLLFVVFNSILIVLEMKKVNAIQIEK